jgi:peptidoglycan/LPS O-acetylase OafA/YrhL
VVCHERIKTLDGWRAIAILAVLACHESWQTGAPRLLSEGHFGVQLFFVLSGFLITRRLLEEHDQAGAISWKHFYLRWAFRILPAAFAMLSVLAILGPALKLILVRPQQILASAFFFRNYVTGSWASGGWYTTHFWSLSVEEHFYLLWPAILIAIGISRGKRAALSFTLGAFLWSIADGRFNWVGHLVHLPGFSDYFYRTDYRIGELFWGCFLAFLWHAQTSRQFLQRFVRSYWVIGIIAVQALLIFSMVRFYETGVELLMGPLVIATVADPAGFIGRILQLPILEWIGRISYSLYLWQELFLPGRRDYWTLGFIQQFPFNLAAVFLIASCSYYVIEKPAIRFGKRIPDRPLRMHRENSRVAAASAAE